MAQIITWAAAAAVGVGATPESDALITNSEEWFCGAYPRGLERQCEWSEHCLVERGVTHQWKCFLKWRKRRMSVA